jgi:hypothetical protein
MRDKIDILELYANSKYSSMYPSVSSKVEVKVTLRPTVSPPIRLGVRRPSGTCDQFNSLLEILDSCGFCYFVAPSLRRGRVCNLLLLLVLASAVRLASAFPDERSGLSFVSMSL